MHNHEPKEYICPLCQIAKGEETEIGNQEETVVFRDEIITAFIAGKWWKSNPGHIIIIPNKHIENIYDMPEVTGHKIADFSKKIAITMKKAYGCDGISTRQHNEPAGNQDVWHYHLHVFPRYNDDNLYLNHKDTYWPTLEEKLPCTEKIKKYINN